MTVPTNDCRCGHPQEAHKAEHDGMCVLAGCQCLTYRPKTVTVAAAQLPPRPAAAPLTSPQSGPTAEQIIAAGKRSESKRTVTLAVRVEAMLTDLRGRVVDERQAVEERRKRDAEAQTARVEVERLERELAAARAKLKGRPPSAKPERSRESLNLACPDCPDTFATGQGLGAHRARKHGYRKAS